MSAFCLWLTRHWPFNSIGWSNRLYIWFLRRGSYALLREIYPPKMLKVIAGK